MHPASTTTTFSACFSAVFTFHEPRGGFCARIQEPRTTKDGRVAFSTHPSRPPSCTKGNRLFEPRPYEASHQIFYFGFWGLRRTVSSQPIIAYHAIICSSFHQTPTDRNGRHQTPENSSTSFHQSALTQLAPSPTLTAERHATTL